MPGSSGSSWRSLWEILNYGTGGLQQLVDAALYISLVLVARAADRVGRGVRWERDESSRAWDDYQVK